MCTMSEAASAAEYQTFFISHCVQMIWTNEPLRGVSCFSMLTPSTLLVPITPDVQYMSTLHPETGTNN